MALDHTELPTAYDDLCQHLEYLDQVRKMENITNASILRLRADISRSSIATTDLVIYRSRLGTSLFGLPADAKDCCRLSQCLDDI